MKEDEWKVIRAGEITVAQGYACKICGVIYGNEPKEHYKKHLSTNQSLVRQLGNRKYEKDYKKLV